MSASMKLSGLLFVVFLICNDRWTFGMSHPKPACRYPPSQWCRSLEIAVECKVQKQCMELNAVKPNQTVAPVSFSLYYESLCPDCRVFITQQLFPTWVMLQDIMSLTLVPYGNAKEVLSANSPFICQHGAPECRGNMIEACMIHLVGNSLAFHIIYCMESSTDVLNAAQPCLQVYAPSVSWSSVESCVNGRLGYQLMHANAVMTRALNPAHTHVPWVTFDGEYTKENEAKAMSSLFHLVCELYKGVKPPACTGASVQLSGSFCSP
ncbi:gamma-interferon-inducible lysosomal thiol reductase-like [Melanotaenia boesemani]|uniref:gamma-interferon-inducible lysosomal thiol reductase-like n=1 Tax=Melanotaenia boesemani TaxID=1250792 RepID=UPI001C042A9A|nr:gamma-interferon-inducible lysosomal thiol reductase-like [Melanotaenia boesemani]